MPLDEENVPFNIATVNLPSGETAELTLTPKDIGIAVVDYNGLFGDDLERVLQFEQVTPNMIKAVYKPESLLDCFVGCFVGKDEPRALVFGGDYYMLSNFTLVDDDGQETEIEKASDSPIISESPHAVDGDGVVAKLLQITLVDDNGEPFTFEGYIFKMANGQYVKLGDMSRGVITAIMADYFVAHAILNGDISGDDMPERIAEILKKLKPKKPRRKETNYTQTSTIKFPSDPVSKSLMWKWGEKHFVPADYWSGKGHEINTGDGGTVSLQVKPAADVEVDAPEEAYVLDYTTHFWATMLFNVARDTDKNEIYGTDILKRAGIKNPYREDSAATLGEASKAITKALRTWIALDTTNERQRKGRKRRKVLESFGLRPAISGNIDFITEAVLDDQGNQTGEIVRDFVITLNRQESITDAFPVFSYADARDMLLTFDESEFEFKGLHLSTDARCMWSYVLAQLKSEKLSNKIKFDTMFNTLAIEARGKDAMRKKKERMITALEKMLIQASGGLKAGQKMKKGQEPQYPRRIDSWKYTKDKAGRVDGVEITPLKGDYPQNK